MAGLVEILRLGAKPPAADPERRKGEVVVDGRSDEGRKPKRWGVFILRRFLESLQNIER
jgi:hypothetical protein